MGFVIALAIMGGLFAALNAVMTRGIRWRAAKPRQVPHTRRYASLGLDRDSHAYRFHGEWVHSWISRGGYPVGVLVFDSARAVIGMSTAGKIRQMVAIERDDVIRVSAHRPGLWRSGGVLPAIVFELREGRSIESFHGHGPAVLATLAQLGWPTTNDPQTR
jgi:hypothetical protein